MRVQSIRGVDRIREMFTEGVDRVRGKCTGGEDGGRSSPQQKGME